MGIIRRGPVRLRDFVTEWPTVIHERKVALKRAALSAAVAVGLGMNLCSEAAPAAEPRPTNDRLPDWAPKPPPRVIEDLFRVEVTMMAAGLDTDLRIDPNTRALGTQFNAEDDLGLDNSDLLPQAEITLLPGERHLIRLSGFAVRRSAQKTITRTIVFDDQTYRAGERVDSDLNLTLVGLTYGFRTMQTERYDFALTFGVQLIDVEANAVVRSRVVRDAESGVAPLPLIGMEGHYDLTQRWSAEGRAQYMSAKVGDVDGSLLDARVALTWRKNPHLLFGLGYRSFGIKADSADKKTPGLVDLQISGPLLFMRASL